MQSADTLLTFFMHVRATANEIAKLQRREADSKACLFSCFDLMMTAPAPPPVPVGRLRTRHGTRLQVLYCILVALVIAHWWE